ncbi:hypothetical protein U8L64_00540, partial [Pseudomonas sp. FIP_A4]
MTKEDHQVVIQSHTTVVATVAAFSAQAAEELKVAATAVPHAEILEFVKPKLSRSASSTTPSKRASAASAPASVARTRARSTWVGKCQAICGPNAQRR